MIVIILLSLILIGIIFANFWLIGILGHIVQNDKTKNQLKGKWAVFNPYKHLPTIEED
jgi:hypothetical protein